MTPLNSKTYELRSHYTSRIQQFQELRSHYNSRIQQSQIPQKRGELIVATDSDKASLRRSSPVYNLTVTPHAGLALSPAVATINSPRFWSTQI